MGDFKLATFKNLSEFYNLIDKATIKTIDYVTDRLVSELNANMIEKGIGLHDSFYSQTGDFYTAWKTEIASRVGEYFSSSLRFDGDSMRLDPDNFTHGSNYYDINDVRDIMPYIIFGGMAGDLFGAGYWTRKRDAWSPTMSRMDRSFGKWLKEGFAQNGFDIKIYNPVVYVVEEVD